MVAGGLQLLVMSDGCSRRPSEKGSRMKILKLLLIVALCFVGVFACSAPSGEAVLESQQAFGIECSKPSGTVGNANAVVGNYTWITGVHVSPTSQCKLDVQYKLGSTYYTKQIDFCVPYAPNNGQQVWIGGSGWSGERLLSSIVRDPVLDLTCWGENGHDNNKFCWKLIGTDASGNYVGGNILFQRYIGTADATGGFTDYGDGATRFKGYGTNYGSGGVIPDPMLQVTFKNTGASTFGTWEYTFSGSAFDTYCND